ncbi:MAG: phage major capsid protein [Sphaerochaeta sp.]|jgi:hypothetical protein|nr:phage major capsid protein [Sphaerochaeta sp.]
MAGKADAAMLDLLRTTLKNLPKDTWEEMWDYQQYPAFNALQDKNISIEGGTSITRNVAWGDSGNFKFVRPYEVDTTVITDRQQEINVPFCHFQTSYAWNKIELAANRGKEQYISYVKSRVVDERKGLVNGLEEAFWNGRVSASDDRNPIGITEILPMADAGSTTSGFVGKTIRYSGGTTGTIFEGLDANTYDKWRSYVQVYSALDNAFLEQFTKACLETTFFIPNFVPQPGDNKIGPSRAVYTSGEIVAKLFSLMGSKDDNYVGSDLLKRQTFVNANGVVSINSMPIMFAPAMTSTYGQLYAVDWSFMTPVVRAGNWLVETDPIQKPDDHKTYVAYLDGSFNMLCKNRRRAGFLMHTPA